MLIDKSLQFADATAIGASTGRRLVGDVIDLSVARDIGNLGNGMPLYLVIQITTAVASAGTTTVQFELASDAQAAIAVDGSATEHITTAAIDKAALVAGYTLVLPLPLEAPAYERYVGVIANVATTAVSAGAFSAFITPDAQVWKAYADGLARI